MPYQNLTLNNVAGELTATYNDNNMRSTAQSSDASGPSIFLTGTAVSGLEMQPYRVASLGGALAEFDSSSDLIKSIAGARKSASPETPISVMRVGAKPFHVMIKKNNVGMQEKDSWIIITPYATKESGATGPNSKSTTEQLGMILMPFREGNAIRQRVLLLNVDTTRVVYDSENKLSPRGSEAVFDVEINVPIGSFLYTPGSFEAGTLTVNTPTLEEIQTLAEITTFKTSGLVLLSETSSNLLDNVSYVDHILLSEILTLDDYNTNNSTKKFSLDKVKGSAGANINHCSRYAANELAYDALEFEDIAFLSCDKCFADVEGVNLTSSMELNAQLSWPKTNLGYLWKYVFNGRPYVFMSRSLTPFSASNVGTYTHDSITYTLTNSGKALGDALNLVEFHLHPKATGTATEVESFFTERGLVECHIDFDSDRVGLDDALGRDEAEFEAYNFVGTGLDIYGVNFESHAANGGFNNDGNGFDTITGLNQVGHEAWMNNAWVEVNAEDMNETEYDAYIAAGHIATIEIQTPFCTLNIKTQRFDSDSDEYIKRYRPSLVDSSADLSAQCLTSTPDMDPFFISHFELTGERVPEAVMSRLFGFTDPTHTGVAVDTASTTTLVAANAEFREVSFLHQSASAAYVASTNYSQTVAIVPTTPPSSARNGVSAWAGNPATYTVQTDGNVTVTANGTGVLGTKLLAGETGYRGGVAFGGVILTKGDDLPNATPYGIDDSDEALDVMGNAIDLGKHAVVVGAYGLLTDPATQYRNNSSGINLLNVTPYLGSAAAIIAGMLAEQPPGTEPIGPIRGRVPGIDATARTQRAVLNNLAALRICMIDQSGTISSLYTAALRTSDYTKISSILAANNILRVLRQQCLSIIGSAYTDSEISALASRLDGVSKNLISQGHAQELSVQLRGSQLDRINGIVRLIATFIPPLSVEAVTIELTLEPPTSGI